MARFATAMTGALEAGAAAEELVARVEAELGREAGPVVGGFMLATAAAGLAAAEVGQRLADRWPEAELLGTSFEGVLAEGRVWRDEPAIVVLAWTGGDGAAIPLVFEPDEQELERVQHELLEAAGRDRLGPEDLILLFPDAMASHGLEALLAGLLPALGDPSIAGAAASGVDGSSALGWIRERALPGALFGLLVPGGKPCERPRVRSAGASRAASPWLEITACRARWIDRLDDERPLDWVRRQLGLESTEQIEPYLDRLLVRVRGRSVAGAAEWTASATTGAGTGEPADAAEAVYEESYLIGIDGRNGSISLPGKFSSGDELAFALPDADLARAELRASIDALESSPMLLQFACCARDEALHGDPDLESALVAHHAGPRSTLGTIAPFQLGPDAAGACRLLVHATVLAALGRG